MYGVKINIVVYLGKYTCNSSKLEGGVVDIIIPLTMIFFKGVFSLGRVYQSVRYRRTPNSDADVGHGRLDAMSSLRVFTKDRQADTPARAAPST